MMFNIGDRVVCIGAKEPNISYSVLSGIGSKNELERLQASGVSGTIKTASKTSSGRAYYEIDFDGININDFAVIRSGNRLVLYQGEIDFDSGITVD